MIAVLCAVESLELPNATRRAALGAAVTFVTGRHAAHAADDAENMTRRRESARDEARLDARRAATCARECASLSVDGKGKYREKHESSRTFL